MTKLEYNKDTDKVVTTYSYWVKNPSDIPVGVHREHSAVWLADTLGSVVFTFYLADGTSYEINYLSFATKSGRLQSENAGFDYFTSGDLVGLWENLSGESEVVSP